MNTQREVFNKLFKEEKTELAEIKIELGIIDDADSIISKANSKSLEAAKYVGLSIRSYAEAAQLSAQAENMLQKALPQAKDLGAKQLVKQIQGFIKGASSRIKRYNKNENTLKAIN